MLLPLRTAPPPPTHVRLEFFVVHIAVGHVRELQLALVRLDKISVLRRRLPLPSPQGHDGHDGQKRNAISINPLGTWAGNQRTWRNQIAIEASAPRAQQPKVGGSRVWSSVPSKATKASETQRVVRHARGNTYDSDGE